MTENGSARTDVLRLAVAPAAEPAGGFQVRVYVNEVEMTSAGAGLGMDPYDLLVPANRLVATPRPHTVPIARCDCGEYGCGSTDVTITRDGDLVRWDWLLEKPMSRGVRFAAGRYDAEVGRAGADHAWETADRTAGRLVLTHVDRAALQAHGLTVSWVANEYRDPELFRVALRLGDDYQVFLDTPWQDSSPEELAGRVCDALARGPGRWRATWHAVKPETAGPPPIARSRWRRETFR